MKSLFAAMALMAAASSLAADASQGLDRISAYAGRWRVSMHHLDTPYSKAGDESHVLQNDCWRNAGFYACDQIVDGVSQALLVFLYDAKTGRYSSYPVPAGGAPQVQPGRLQIMGDTWTFPWDNTEQGKTTHFRVVNVWRSPDSIEFRQEYSTDGTHWILMAEGHETRIKG